MTFQVVFNLYPFNEALFLPSANIVRSDSDGQLTHFMQRATAATLVPYGVELTPLLTRLLDIVDLLSPKSLENKYKQPKTKNSRPLDQLLADKAVKPVVEKFIYSNLDQFLSEIVRHKLPLTLDAERKTLAKDVLVRFSREEVVPHLFFKKNTEGIEYRLRLGPEGSTWSLRERNVLPLTNTDPAWLIIDYVLYKVSGINGNMVKPFRQKDAVLIPPDKERVYFRQFIAKSIRRSRVEAEGFRVEKSDVLCATRLEPLENVLENRWFFKPVFEYEGAEFLFGDRRDRVTSLDIPEDDEREITVHLICRNDDDEAQRVQSLKNLGMEESGRLFGTGDSSLSSVLHFLTNHRVALEAAGFTVVAPEVDGKTMALVAGNISVRSEAAGDWFDVQGRVTAGDYSFPFQKLLPNLRRGDRFFPLPDGTWFHIPEEWFARYADLAEAVQEQNDHLRLPKSLYTVLQETLPDDDLVSSLPVIDPESIDYQPSAGLKASLRPYQLRGVKWLIGHYRHGFGACLADDMGLGKTLQTIAVLLHAKEKPALAPAVVPNDAPLLQLDLFQQFRQELSPLNALIILPASLVFNWQRELAKFA
ncbi:MAG: SNF2 helicase associated domain-containing protein, partial [Saprospiraceae bacterium]|nr:SNF2 helicase associated domain-containing protein [Saprospiraceae bacterium]